MSRQITVVENKCQYYHKILNFIIIGCCYVCTHSHWLDSHDCLCPWLAHWLCLGLSVPPLLPRGLLCTLESLYANRWAKQKIIHISSTIIILFHIPIISQSVRVWPWYNRISIIIIIKLIKLSHMLCALLFGLASPTHASWVVVVVVHRSTSSTTEAEAAPAAAAPPTVPDDDDKSLIYSARLLLLLPLLLNRVSRPITSPAVVVQPRDESHCSHSQRRLAKRSTTLEVQVWACEVKWQ